MDLCRRCLGFLQIRFGRGIFGLDRLFFLSSLRFGRL
ncbi:TPA: hypothetical protein DCK82_01015 [Candidatus Beckwithbacteria bacterium]|nr:hypothetical protein [Candidatus Beckwithbacteria bacterium]HCQ93091.1 hypothetical protein [Candidatus Beckwithbacteria bacterium]